MIKLKKIMQVFHLYNSDKFKTLINYVQSLGIFFKTFVTRFKQERRSSQEMTLGKLTTSNPLSSKLQSLFAISVDANLQLSLNELPKIVNGNSTPDLTKDLENNNLKNNKSLINGYALLNNVFIS